VLVFSPIMPLNEPDRSWVREQIRDSQQAENKVAKFFKHWLPLLIAGGGVLWFLNGWSGYVTFRTNTGDRLGVIEKSSETTTSEIKDLRLSIQNLSKVGGFGGQDQ
jgi:hypothetical protein